MVVAVAGCSNGGGWCGGGSGVKVVEEVWKEKEKGKKKEKEREE